ncbi:MAG: hypothetical protein RLZZ200_113 [Pseudomonadota bacterium]|jgi:hypothetical protein
MPISRRQVLSVCAGLAAWQALPAASGLTSHVGPRFRLIIDNDLSGDPDGLFQFVHHLLSPKADIRLVVGSHLHAGEPFAPTGSQARLAAEKAREVYSIMGLANPPPVLAGAEYAIADIAKVERTPAAEAIIAEAMRDDSPLPLYYCVGAGLTDLATALRLEPRIAGRMTLVWIGGEEYPGLGLPLPGPRQAEYNTTIDVKAVQQVFNETDLAIWQVPRNVYRQMLVTFAELEARLRPTGPLGVWLLGQLEGMVNMIATLPPSMGIRVGETYVLGDSPLVTLTSLQTFFEPDSASSPWVTRPRPTILADGGYGKPSKRKPIRVYTAIDTRLTFEDLYAKLALFGKGR